jgi:hypothetical protein
MEREFLEKLNTTEIEYGECKQLIDRDNPLSQDALFSKFSGNVCELLGVEKADTAAYADVFMKVFDLVIESYDKLNLSETIREVGKEL